MLAHVTEDVIALKHQVAHFVVSVVVQLVVLCCLLCSCVGEIVLNYESSTGVYKHFCGDVGRVVCYQPPQLAQRWVCCVHDGVACSPLQFLHLGALRHAEV